VPRPADDRRRAQAIAAAAVQAAGASGIDLPRTLRIWSLTGDDAAGSTAVAPAEIDDMATVLEQVTSPRQRRTNGLHVTPPWLADLLVERCLADLSGEPTVCDPACGGGAFLLAAARALESRGVPRPVVVRDLLWGADVDPIGLAAAELALTLWAGSPPPPGRLVVGDALVRGASLWRARPSPGFDAVVGNPPFLNQLGRATTRRPAATERLRARFGDAVQTYTDAAWLFLVAGCDLVRPGGRVTLIQPVSVVAARDAAAVRSALAGRATLEDLWVEDPTRPAFAAAVQVCAPLLATHVPEPPATPPPPGIATPAPPPAAAVPPTPPATAAAGAATGDEVVPGVADESLGATASRDGVVSGVAGGGVGSMTFRDVDRAWATRLADAVGVPSVSLGEGARAVLGERAEVAAGFRDEYYGLIPLVREAATGEGDPGAPLVTTGIVDWGRSGWGRRPTRFAKRQWSAPVVDVALLDGAAGRPNRAVRRWIERTAGPKLLVATQTRVVELAVDEQGSWVPSVPTLAIVPRSVDDLWLLAAAVASPTATAWLWRRAPGTALSRNALKVAARDLSELPLPVDAVLWAAAADAFRAYASAPSAAAFEDYVVAAAGAYDAPDDLVAWWRDRVEPVIDSTRDVEVPLV